METRSSQSSGEGLHMKASFPRLPGVRTHQVPTLSLSSPVPLLYEGQLGWHVGVRVRNSVFSRGEVGLLSVVVCATVDVADVK